jgi:hypothetical protein
LDGFFTATPKTSAPKASAKDAKGKDKGKGTKRKVSCCIALVLHPCGLCRLTCPIKTDDKDEARAGKKSKAKK